MKPVAPDPEHTESLCDDAPEPPSERPAGDALLGVEEVQAMFPHATSRWWVRTTVAPEDRMRIGKRCYWWRSDVVRWLNGHKQRVD